MPQYQYTVKRGPQDLESGVMEASTRQSVVSQLRDMGFYPVSVEEYTDTATGLSLGHTFARIKLKDRNVFFRQLANLTQAGMPILRALSTLRNQAANPRLASVIESLHDSVQKGSSFAAALAEHPKVFPAMYTSLVRAGEEGGMLDETLWRIVAFGEQDEELRGKAFAAMVYPAFLLIMGAAAIFILVSFVFPNFVEVFDDFDASLPWITVIVIGLCEFMGTFWWAVLLGLLLVVIAGRAYLRTERGRLWFDTKALQVPLAGSLVQRYEMAKFARTLGTLFDNGVPVLSALRITGETLTNRAVRSEVESIEKEVAQGESISGGLARTQHFPPLLVSMIAVGEEGGKLGEVTKRVADAYDVEVDRAVKALMSVLEPLLIVVMGVIIGTLVIAMLLPMLTLSAQVR